MRAGWCTGRFARWSWHTAAWPASSSSQGFFNILYIDFVLLFTFTFTFSGFWLRKRCLCKLCGFSSKGAPQHIYGIWIALHLTLRNVEPNGVQVAVRVFSTDILNLAFNWNRIRLISKNSTISLIIVFSKLNWRASESLFLFHLHHRGVRQIDRPQSVFRFPFFRSELVNRLGKSSAPPSMVASPPAPLWPSPPLASGRRQPQSPLVGPHCPDPNY